MRRILFSLLDLFFPRYCCSCGKILGLDEKYLCVECRMGLTIEAVVSINNGGNDSRNDAEILRLKWNNHKYLLHIGFFAVYEKNSIVAKTIQHFKYHHASMLGVFLGEMSAYKLAGKDFFEEVDVLIPMPTTKEHWMRRGYNPSQMIARGIAHVFAKPIIVDCLLRKHNSESQTSFTKIQREERYNEIFEDFYIGNKYRDGIKLSGNHILLIDDVMTTGTTMSAALTRLGSIPNIKISVFAWARVK